MTALDLALPLIAAPMAGGPTTPALVVAAAGAGALGFLAGGYKTPEALLAEVAAVRAQHVRFGVNLFAPNPVPAVPAEYRRYRDLIQAEADRFGLRLPADPVEDDDAWLDKIDLLLRDPVPVVSFTFGIPPASVITALRKAGTVVVQTVTSAGEARLAADAGVDALAVQASAAGGHSGTLTPGQIPPSVPLADLIAAVRGITALPLIGAGGVATPGDVAAALAAGAEAAMVGTVLLLTDESGASPAYRAGLASPDRGGTVVTRAFTGGPRGHFKITSPSGTGRSRPPDIQRCII